MSVIRTSILSVLTLVLFIAVSARFSISDTFAPSANMLRCCTHTVLLLLLFFIIIIMKDPLETHPNPIQKCVKRIQHNEHSTLVFHYFFSLVYFQFLHNKWEGYLPEQWRRKVFFIVGYDWRDSANMRACAHRGCLMGDVPPSEAGSFCFFQSDLVQCDGYF